MKKNDKLDYLVLTWNEWKKELSATLSSLSSSFPEIKSKQIKLGNVRKNCGKKKVIDDLKVISKKDEKVRIDVSTIHGSKGMTLDAVLLVSSYNSSKNDDGSGAHWKEWFNNATINEKNRLAYVAFSRPKFLLALGIPKTNNFSDNDRKILIQHGFKILE